MQHVFFAFLVFCSIECPVGQLLFFTEAASGWLARLDVHSSAPVPVTWGDDGASLTNLTLLDTPMGVTTLGTTQSFSTAVGGKGFARAELPGQSIYTPNTSSADNNVWGQVIGTNYSGTFVRSVVFQSVDALYIGLWASPGPGIYSLRPSHGVDAMRTLQVSSPCPESLVFSMDKQTLFWSDICEGTIKSIFLGTASTRIVRTVRNNLVQPKGLAFGGMYTIMFFIANYRIMSGTVDATVTSDSGVSLSDVQVIVSEENVGIVAPIGLAVFSCAGYTEKIYWSDACTDKIQRASTNGLNFEDVVVGAHRVIGLSVVCPPTTTTTTRTTTTSTSNATTSSNSTTSTTTNTSRTTTSTTSTTSTNITTTTSTNQTTTSNTSTMTTTPTGPTTTNTTSNTTTTTTTSTSNSSSTKTTNSTVTTSTNVTTFTTTNTTMSFTTNGTTTTNTTSTSTTVTTSTSTSTTTTNSTTTTTTSTTNATSYTSTNTTTNTTSTTSHTSTSTATSNITTTSNTSTTTTTTTTTSNISVSISTNTTKSTVTTTNATTTTNTSTSTTTNTSANITTTTYTSTTSTNTTTSITSTSSNTTTTTTFTTSSTTTNTSTSTNRTTTTTTSTTTSTMIVCSCGLPLYTMANYSAVEANEAAAASQVVVMCTTTTTTTSTSTTSTTTSSTSTTVAGGCPYPTTQDGTFTNAGSDSSLWTLTCVAGKMPVLSTGNQVTCQAGSFIPSPFPTCVNTVTCDASQASSRTAGGATGTTCSTTMDSHTSCQATCPTNTNASGAISCVGGTLFGQSSCVALTSGTVAQSVTNVMGSFSANFNLAPSESDLKTGLCNAFTLTTGCSFVTQASPSFQTASNVRLLLADRILTAGTYRVDYKVATYPTHSDPNLRTSIIAGKAKALSLTNSAEAIAFKNSSGITVTGNITTIVAPTLEHSMIVLSSQGQTIAPAAPSPPAPSPPSSSESGGDTGAIIGAVCGGVGGFLVIVVGCVLYFKYCRAKKAEA